MCFWQSWSDPANLLHRDPPIQRAPASNPAKPVATLISLRVLLMVLVAVTPTSLPAILAVPVVVALAFLQYFR